MKKCVILSMDDSSDFSVYDHLLIEPLSLAGWTVKTISWRDENVNWNEYQLVMIRSPWDYQLDCDAFLEVLKTIENSSAHLDNPIEIVHWNINKKYLQNLEHKGVEIVPTVWREDIYECEIDVFFNLLDTSEIVIKPCISAGAFDTYRIKRKEVEEVKNELIEKFKHRECMIQPFMPNIVDEGEFSLFYFDGEYSHSILKTPKEKDFRVQEEWGGNLLKVEPEERLKQCATKVLGAIDTSLLYARLDFVRTSSGFALMEAELIEPSLYFNLDDESPQRFVDAVERRMKRLSVI